MRRWFSRLAVAVGAALLLGICVIWQSAGERAQPMRDQPRDSAGVPFRRAIIQTSLPTDACKLEREFQAGWAWDPILVYTFDCSPRGVGLLGSSETVILTAFVSSRGNSIVRTELVLTNPRPTPTSAPTPTPWTRPGYGG